jgi:hypothetical protein
MRKSTPSTGRGIQIEIGSQHYLGLFLLSQKTPPLLKKGEFISSFGKKKGGAKAPQSLVKKLQSKILI